MALSFRVEPTPGVRLISRSVGAAAFVFAAAAWWAFPPGSHFADMAQAWGMALAAGFLLARPLAGLRLGAGRFWTAAAALLLGSALLSWITSPWPGAGREPIWRLAACLVLAAAAARWAAAGRQTFTAAAGAFLLAVAVVYLVNVAIHPRGAHAYPFGNGNIAGGFLAPVFTAVWAYILFHFERMRPRGRAHGRPPAAARWAAAVLVALSGWGVWASDSQSAWAAAAFGASLAAWRRFAGNGRWPLFAAAGGGVAAAGLACAWLSLPDHPHRSRAEYLRYETTAGYRIMMAEGAVSAWRESPWLGWGPGAFFQVFTRHRPDDFFASRRIGTWENDPHGGYWRLLVEEGVVGLAAHGTVLIWALRRGWVCADPLRAAAACGLACAMANDVVSIASFLPQVQALQWILVFVAAGAGRSTEPSAPARPVGGWRHAAWGALALFWWVEAVGRRGTWFHEAAAGHQAFQEGISAPDVPAARRAYAAAALRFDRACADMERVGEGSALLPNAAYMLARSRLRSGDAAGALRAHRRVERHTAAFSNLDLERGKVYALLGDRARAAACFRRYARVRLYEPRFYWRNVSPPPMGDLRDAAYWGGFGEALARAQALRRWDLEIASTRAVFARRAGDVAALAAATAAADRLYREARDIQDFAGIGAYAKHCESIDPTRARAVLDDYLAEHPGHPEASFYRDALLRRLPAPEGASGAPPTPEVR